MSIIINAGGGGTSSGEYVWRRYDNNGLPSGYKPLEYIESSGTEYIDTSYIAVSENYRIKCKICITNIATNAVLFGGGDSSTDIISMLMTEDSQLKFYVGSESVSEALTPFSIGTDYEIECSANNGTFTVTLDDISSSGTYSGTINKEYPLFIFANNVSGSVSQFSSIMIYWFQIYDNGILVRDYIPCEYNGTVGLYDLVNDVFYMNSGTGTFTGDMPGDYKWVVDKNIDKYPQNGMSGKYWYEFGTGGKYLWKKYKQGDYSILSFTQITNGINPVQLKVTSEQMDLSTVDESFFVGMTITYNLNDTVYECKVQENNVMSITFASTTYTWHYEPFTQVFSISGVSWTTDGRTFDDIKIGFDKYEYVASNSSTEYPNGAELDGYRYESVEANLPMVYIAQGSVNSGETKTISIPSEYDMNKIAVLVNSQSTTGFTITKNISDHSITITKTSSYNAVYQIYYIPICSRVENYIVQVTGDYSIATTLTTKYNYQKSIILLPQVDLSLTYAMAMDRNDTTLRLAMLRSTNTSCISEVIF